MMDSTVLCFQANFKTLISSNYTDSSLKKVFNPEIYKRKEEKFDQRTLINDLNRACLLNIDRETLELEEIKREIVKRLESSTHQYTQGTLDGSIFSGLFTTAILMPEEHENNFISFKNSRLAFIYREQDSQNLSGFSIDYYPRHPEYWIISIIRNVLAPFEDRKVTIIASNAVSQSINLSKKIINTPPNAKKNSIFLMPDIIKKALGNDQNLHQLICGIISNNGHVNINEREKKSFKKRFTNRLQSASEEKKDEQSAELTDYEETKIIFQEKTKKIEKEFSSVLSNINQQFFIIFSFYFISLLFFISIFFQFLIFQTVKSRVLKIGLNFVGMSFGFFTAIFGVAVTLLILTNYQLENRLQKGKVGLLTLGFLSYSTLSIMFILTLCYNNPFFRHHLGRNHLAKFNSPPYLLPLLFITARILIMLGHSLSKKERYIKASKRDHYQIISLITMQVIGLTGLFMGSLGKERIIDHALKEIGWLFIITIISAAMLSIKAYFDRSQYKLAGEFSGLQACSPY